MSAAIRSVASRRSVAIPAAVIAVLFAIWAWFSFGSPIDGTHLPNSGFGDPPQATWFLEWFRYALAHGLNPFHTDRIDVPGGVNLADNTSMPLVGLLAWPLTVLFGPVSAFNALLRLSVLAATGGMWILLRSICTSRRAALIGAVIYSFSPYVATEVQGDAHLDLAFVAIPPLIAWAVIRLVRRSAHPVALGATIGVLGGAQVLIAPEVLSDFTIVVTVGIVGALVLRPRSTLRQMRPLLVPAAVALGCFAAIGGYPLIYAFAGSGHLTGPVQNPAFLQLYAADLLGPLVPSAHQLVTPGSLAQTGARFADGNPTENLAYLSLPVLVLLAYCAVRLRRHRAVVGAVGLATIAFLLSLGSRLTINGHRTTVPLPEALLPHLPLLGSTVPSRFALEVSLFVVVALAVSLDRAWLARPPSGVSRAARIAWPLALVLCAIALLPARVTNGPIPLSDPVGQLLATVPENTVVLTYPYPKTPQSTPMVWQAADGLRTRLIGGYATVNGPGGFGVATAPLLPPPSVQEFLTEEQEGGAYFYPPVAPADATAADLCAFIARYGVGAVLDASGGGDADRAVRAYFTSAMGPPSLVGQGVALYRPNGRCSTTS